MPDEIENAEAEIAGIPEAAFAKASDQIRVRTDRYRQVYANNMTLSFSTWDVSVTFGELTGQQEGKSVIEETVKVLMTREIVKVLATLLQNHVAIFEAKYGEIKLPVPGPSPESPAINKADTEPQG
jgi:hypothetical protein